MHGKVDKPGVWTNAVGWLLVLLLWISPWYYAGATWSFQYLLFFAGVLLAILLALSVIASDSDRRVLSSPPGLAWILLSLGIFAQIQSIRAWDVSSENSTVFPSIAIQRWAIGEQGNSSEACGRIEDEPALGKLALSVEPLTTQGASSSLFLCALMVWGASTVWGHRKAYPQFFILVTVLGLLIGAYGLLGVFNRSKPNLLGLSYGSSFSVFVSKNSAGAFLNIALAAAIGLVVWCGEKIYSSVARQMSTRDMRQWNWKAKFQYGLKTTFEKIEPTVVASSLAALFLAFCVAISLCRGAFISALVAVFACVAIGWPGRKRQAILVASFLSMVVAVIAMASLQLDQTTLSRIESIESFDLELENQSGRLYIWQVAARAAQQYGLLGSGLGTFHVASLPFQSPSSRGWYYHAESLVAEIFVTMGYLGLVAALVGLILTIFLLLKIYHSKRFRDYLPLQVAGAFFLASQTLHACIDFAWILPGVYVPSSLFLGALQGGQIHSGRAYRRIHNLSDPTTSSKRQWLMRILSIAFAGLCGTLLWLNQRSVSVLALSEKAEKQLAIDGSPSLQSDSSTTKIPLVERWVHMCAKAYSSDQIDAIYQSPTMLRLLANGIVQDTRVKLWEKRPAGASSELAWNQTSPVVVRLAVQQASQTERPNVIESLGGELTMIRFQKANYWFQRGQLLSPLDWRFVWGRISTAIECPAEDLKALIPVLATTSAHRPANLTSASLIFSDSLSDQEKLDLWKTAIRANRAEAVPIAEIIAKTYRDDQVPIEVFPSEPQVLRKIYNQIFTSQNFPNTHKQLGEKLIASSSKLPWPGLRKANWMADIARETGSIDLEIQNLTIILGLDRSNVPHLKRIISLLIESKQKDKAQGFLRQLLRASPSDPSIETINQQIDGIEP